METADGEAMRNNPTQNINGSFNEFIYKLITRAC
jgi:hypothetical protein